MNTTAVEVRLGTDHGQPISIVAGDPVGDPAVQVGGMAGSGTTRAAAAVHAQLAAQRYAETRTPAAPAATEGEER